MSAPPKSPRRGFSLGWPAHAGLLVFVAALVSRSHLPAEPFPKDPVEAFRQALLLENSKVTPYKNRLSEDDKGLKLAIALRRRNLDKTAKALRTTSELSRALLLIDWPRSPKTESDRRSETEYDREARIIEKTVREEMAGRLLKEVRAALKGSETGVARQVATANLVGETVGSAGNLQDDNLQLYSDLDPLASDLAALATASSPLVREAAARALGNFPTSPKIAAEGLRQMLGSDNTESTRKAAADGLLALAQTVSTNQPLRGSEPGVSVRETRRTGQSFNFQNVTGLIREVTKAAGFGLDDSSVAVRRQCVNALRQGAEAIEFEVKVLLPTSVAEIPLPPTERESSPRERERIEEYRAELNEKVKGVAPALKAFRDQGPALLRAAIDSDSQVRLGARRTLDALAQARELLIKLGSALPPKIDPIKGGKDVRLAPNGVNRVAFFQKDDKPKDNEDKDDDPIGNLLKLVGEGIVRSGFRDPYAPSRRAAVETIEAMGPSGAEFIPQLAERLKDSDVFVRWISARALGKLAPRRAELVVPALICQLEDVDLDPRIAATKALGLYGAGAASAVPTLSALLLKGDAEFRIAVMKALEGIGTDSVAALPNLKKSLRDPDPRVRTEAAFVIGRFGPLARDYVEALRELTTDPDSDVRKAASASILTILAE